MSNKRKSYPRTSDENGGHVQPLIIKVVRNEAEVNSLRSLCSYNIISCEFCDEVFYNKYYYLIHNASHIIIPLIKLIVYQCAECLHHFTSERKLKQHITKKHTSQQCDNINISSKLKLNKSLKQELISSQNKLHDESNLELKKNELLIPQNKLQGESKLKHKGIKLKIPQNKLQAETKLNIKNNELLIPQDKLQGESKLKHKKNELLIPQNKFQDDTKLKHKKNDLIIPQNKLQDEIEVFDENDTDIFISDINSNGIRNRILFEEELNAVVTDEDNRLCDSHENNSVHYDELMKSKSCVCRVCGVKSINRYWAIRHEKNHITIKQKELYFCPKCDYYISDLKHDLTKHIKEKHGIIKKQYKESQCRKCGLNYVYHYKHNKNYHWAYFCKVCGAGFEYDYKLEEHVVECERMYSKQEKEGRKMEETMKLCEICYSFLKNKQDFHYVHVGDHCEIGERLPCKKCSKICFELKIVKRIRLAERCQKISRRSAGFTNRDRLKNIQHRLKMMRKYCIKKLGIVSNILDNQTATMNSETLHPEQSAKHPDCTTVYIKIEPLEPEPDVTDDTQANNILNANDIKVEPIPIKEEEIECKPEINTNQEHYIKQEGTEYDEDTHVVVKTEYIDTTEESPDGNNSISGKENDNFPQQNESHVLKNNCMEFGHTGIIPVADHFLHLNKNTINVTQNKSKQLRINRPEKPHSCEVCQKCFKRKAHLKEHMYTHTGEKPFSCEICKRCFSTKSNLREHTSNHSNAGEKPYTCEVCKKCFSTKGNLKEHSLIHTGEKPYSCTVCKKCFRVKTNLTEHMLIHTGEKPYDCHICKKCFKTKRYLKQHVLIHSGGKPYNCDLCKKFFKTKKCLRQHLDSIHTEKPHSCDVCSTGFRTKQELKKHIFIHAVEKSVVLCVKNVIEQGLV
ncbi:zinc finger protein 184-like [Achroia grisella]|uniref:zinc finger protein 184-like n=1 Tax=Achroia grisella TaxID=688607 RepID=UPI0027D2FC0C|nr:zinc finger protein 184-like [Achroia grisella]